MSGLEPRIASSSCFSFFRRQAFCVQEVLVIVGKGSITVIRDLVRELSPGKKTEIHRARKKERKKRERERERIQSSMIDVHNRHLNHQPNLTQSVSFNTTLDQFKAHFNPSICCETSSSTAGQIISFLFSRHNIRTKPYKSQGTSFSNAQFVEITFPFATLPLFFQYIVRPVFTSPISNPNSVIPATRSTNILSHPAAAMMPTVTGSVSLRRVTLE